MKTKEIMIKLFIIIRRVLKSIKKQGSKNGTASSLNKIGNIYQNKGDYIEAYNYYIKSLELRNEIGDKVGIAHSYNNIGINFRLQGNFVKAIDFQIKSLKVKEEIV